jgi:hypothetical protein
VDLPNIPGSYYDRIMDARELMDLERWDEAALIYDRILERLLRLPERRRRSGTVQHSFLVTAAADLQYARAQQGDYEGVIALSRQLQDWDPDEAAYWRRQIALQRIDIKGEVDEGLQDMLALAEAEPGDLDHWLDLGRQALDHQRLELAEDALARAENLALEINDGDGMLTAKLAFVDLRRAQGRWSEALAAWRAVLTLDERVDLSRELMVRMCLAAGLWDDAQALLDDESLGVPIANFYRAYLAGRRGDRVRAQYLWRQVAEADLEEHPEALLAQALAFCWLGQPGKALSLVLQEVRAFSELPGRWPLVLALAWAMEGDLEAARFNLALAQRRLAAGGQRGELSQLDWYDFDVLIEDEPIKDALMPYFQVGDN